MRVPQDLWAQFIPRYQDLLTLKPWMTPADAEAVVMSELKDEMLRERFKVVEMVTGKPPHEQARDLLIEAELKTREAHMIISQTRSK
jgi:hypothetical protein